MSAALQQGRGGVRARQALEQPPHRSRGDTVPEVLERRVDVAFGDVV